MKGIQERVAYQAAVSPRVREPPPPPSQCSAYAAATPPRPVAAATARKIQPIALPGWREAIRAPTTENVIASATTRTSSSSPGREAALAARSPSASPAKAQARRVDARPLIVP